MYESLIIAPPMFCCGYHKQPIPSRAKSEHQQVRSIPRANGADGEFGGHLAMARWPATTADVLYRPGLSVGEGHWPASGPWGHSGIAAAGVGKTSPQPPPRSPSLHKNQTPPGAT